MNEVEDFPAQNEFQALEIFNWVVILGMLMVKDTIVIYFYQNVFRIKWKNGKCAKNKFYCETYTVYLIMSLNGLCSTLLKAQSNPCMLLWPISSVAIQGLLWESKIGHW